MPLIQAPSGFDEGTETSLNPTQMAEIIPWAQNSEETLRELLQTTQSFEFRDAHDTLLRVIKDTVLASAPKHTETLMRYVLNRAIKADAIIEEQADVNQPGVIDIQVRILRGSIAMALKYYKNDLEYLNGRFVEKRTDLTNLPFAAFGLDYADFLMTLNQSIIDASAQYSVAILALGLLQWDLYRDSDRLLYSSVIAKVNRFLKTAPALAPVRDQTSVQWMPKIKRVYLDSSRSATSLMKQANKQTPNLNTPSGRRTNGPSQGFKLGYSERISTPNGMLIVVQPTFRYGNADFPLSHFSSLSGIQALADIPGYTLFSVITDSVNSNEKYAIVGGSGQSYGFATKMANRVNYRIDALVYVQTTGLNIVKHSQYSYSTSENSDGTVAIVRPRLEFGNKSYLVSKRSDLDGVCKFYGYNRKLNYQLDGRDNAQPTLVFGSEGQINGRNTYDAGITNEALMTLTCE